MKNPDTPQPKESMVKKNGLAGVTAFMVLVLPLSGLPARCQQQSTSSPTAENAALPDGPTQATTCTKSNGKPCAEWVHELIGQNPPSSESGIAPAERDAASVHFWTYRGWEEPPLRSNKQGFHSKLFLTAHIGGVIAMAVACRTKNSREEWSSEVPAVAAMFGMDYLQFRYIGGPNAVAAPVYEMIHYSRASTR